MALFQPMNALPVLAARRILIYGVTGAGKTTFAQRLGRSTGIPWHEADAMCWNPGWQSVPKPEQRARAQALVAGEAWILDSAYGGWIDIVLPRIQLIVALDYPRWLSLARLSMRTADRVMHRRPVCNGNRETLGKALSGDSILLWHFRSFSSKRRRMRAWAADPSAPPTLLLSSPKAAEAWLKGLCPSPG
ncbi:MAG: adenylate kinase [Phycisphaerae bacterium]